MIWGGVELYVFLLWETLSVLELSWDPLNVVKKVLKAYNMQLLWLQIEGIICAIWISNYIGRCELANNNVGNVQLPAILASAVMEERREVETDAV